MTKTRHRQTIHQGCKQCCIIDKYPTMYLINSRNQKSLKTENNIVKLT